MEWKIPELQSETTAAKLRVVQTGKKNKHTQQFRRENNNDKRKDNNNKRPDKAAIEEIVRHVSELQKMIEQTIYY